MRTVTIYGDPFLCCTDDCKRYAVVVLRTVSQDGTPEYVAFCKQHHTELRRAYQASERTDTPVMNLSGGNDEAEVS